MNIMKTRTRESAVQEFHTAMGTDVSVEPRANLLRLREKLLVEECTEVVAELQTMQMELERGKPITKEQWAKLLKELCDLQYVLSGTVVSFNAIVGSFTPAFNRVHSSNMSKLDDEGNPVLNSYGKVTKGPNYKAPNLEDLIT
tara:strand:- start:625 stop:1053 length:429 start_codon:yes stop_codon:yes gene_type:complete